ncbi:MAG TPA: Gfo/Idh/MocA family oxidoreductase [Blastocatellia bacterium]|nr:Gfo/Idh/MocA family oxidoreductase [Blastocatellia bacterium]
MKTFTRLFTLAISLFVIGSAFTADRQQAAIQEVIKVGIIGTDTSHVPAFTKLLNDPKEPGYIPGARVVAAFKGGSADVESSYKRVDNYATEIHDKYGVEIVASIEELLGKVDAVLLESVDGRPHLAQARPVFKAKKRVFIDKPFAASYADAREIVRLARESGTPFFSSSSLRYANDIVALKSKPELGGILGAMAFSPSPTEAHHPDLFWYGIHGVETLFTLMGTGCESVARTNTAGTDVVTGKWKDGRIGTFRGIRDGKQDYGAIAFGAKANALTTPPMKVDYRNLLVEIIKFFQTGVAPIQPEETLEIMAFMEAADLSKARNGAPVMLSEIQNRK